MNRIAFITDLHLLEKSVEKKGVDTVQNGKTVLNDVKAKGISRIILGGDLGEKEALEMLFNDLQSFEFEYILGNHDSIKNYREFDPRTEGKAELFFTSEINGHDCIFLDTSSYKLSKEQQGFLEEWLVGAVNPVIFIHHPVLNIGTWMDRQHPLKNREKVEEIINAEGKKVTLICGHYHQHHEKSSEFIRQIIAPAVSYQIPFGENYQKDSSTFGNLILDFAENNIQIEEVMFNKSSSSKTGVVVS